MKIAACAALMMVVCSTPSVAFVAENANRQIVEATPINADIQSMNGADLLEEISAVANPYGVDQTVTGSKITQEELGVYYKRRQEFLNCPTCAMDQPYPSD